MHLHIHFTTKVKEVRGNSIKTLKYRQGKTFN